jgi:conjugal transfer/entry exclusion protein
MPNGSGSGGPMVSNPMYTALNNLYQQLSGDEHTMSTALTAADQQMGQGGTWVGPTATTWGNQLHGYSTDCQTQVTSMLNQVKEAMAGLPQQVTQTEAAGISKQMSMIERGDM